MIKRVIITDEHGCYGRLSELYHNTLKIDFEKKLIEKRRKNECGYVPYTETIRLPKDYDQSSKADDCYEQLGRIEDMIYSVMSFFETDKTEVVMCDAMPASIEICFDDGTRKKYDVYGETLGFLNMIRDKIKALIKTIKML